MRRANKPINESMRKFYSISQICKCWSNSRTDGISREKEWMTFGVKVFLQTLQIRYRRLLVIWYGVTYCIIKVKKGYVIDKWEHFRCKRNKQEMIAVFVSILKGSKSHVAPLEIVGNYMAVNQMC